MRHYFPVLTLLAVPCIYLATNLLFVQHLDRSVEGPASAEADREIAFNAEMASVAPVVVSRLPALYLAHGGGPMPVLGEPGHLGLAKFMKAWPATVPKPSAIVVVSAHWEVSLHAWAKQEWRGASVSSAGGWDADIATVAAALIRQPSTAKLACVVLFQAPVARVTSAPLPDL
jgi:hypothetical protein